MKASRVEVEASAVEQDGVSEAVPIAVAAGSLLERLDLRVHGFQMSVGHIQHDGAQRQLELPASDN
jgi:hypothetical protein